MAQLDYAPAVDRSNYTPVVWIRKLIVPRRGTIAPYLLVAPSVMLLIFFIVVPLAALLVLSFSTFEGTEGSRQLTFQNYREIFAIAPEGKQGRIFNGPYIQVLVRSVAVSLITTSIVVGLAYPMAYYIAFGVRRLKTIWIVLITIPFWTSYLLRIFSWKLILGYNGILNATLMKLGWIDQPLEFLLYNPSSVIIALSHAWLAFAVLPIYVSLERIDKSLLEAAADLGEGPVARFIRVTLPLSKPGVIAAALLVFIPTVGDYVTPTLVGGPSGTMIGNLIDVLFGRADNAPLGAAVSWVSMMTIASVVLVALFVVSLRAERKPRHERYGT
jgi:spermidine/putrescine transport system permease protein